MKGTPEFVGTVAGPEGVEVEMLFVPVFEGDDELSDLPGLDAATGGAIARARAGGEYRSHLYESFITPVISGPYRAARVALVGAGRKEDLTAERLRRVAAACGYTARLRSIRSVGFIVRDGVDALNAAKHAADGFSAAEFDSGAHKSVDQNAGKFVDRVVIVAKGADSAALIDAVFRGRTVGESANWARSLANEPANILTPKEFATRVADECRRVGLSVEVLDEDRIRELKMGLLLGVAQGSAEPPRLVVIRYDPPGAPEQPVLGLVGKGITFDTGGVSIKPADGMERMKHDMTGGASVAAAMRSLAILKGTRRVLAVIPMAENAVGGRATRPSDVLLAASGTTVEIINTDAEGRLILGDALWYAQELGATHLVDVATLTGACVVALGRAASGMFGQPDGWIDRVDAASRRAGDRMWRLPVYDEYREMLRSEVADIVNSAGRWAGASTAAAFLREFVNDKPWAHLDIAGTAWSEERKPYQPKGATGVAVRTLTELGLMADL
ncbi:MAG TPA: leucyl aminopeptidase [Vicinamibacterales bacterium]|nr:leucyl aminopeptidase [Vicinamibacterales bacterium]